MTKPAKQDGARELPHVCHWPGCGKLVPPSMWGCKPHWFRLPKRIRYDIWNAYVRGQEVRRDPSRDYIVAARAAQIWIAEQEATR